VVAVSTPPVERDAKDWTWVLERRCPECGYSAREITAGEIGPRARAEMATLAAALSRPDATVRPQPTTWSALEYGCHVRDVCTIFHTRLRRICDETDPLFDNWDQDETALSERYWEQQPATVISQMEEAAQRVAAAFDAVQDDQWTRTGRRTDGARFSALSLGQYFLHDLVHHAHDVS
jgi:hypothetical protein